MKDQSFLNSLADFTDLRYAGRADLAELQTRPREAYYSNVSSNPKSAMSAEQELELKNNDKLIRNFKDLKDQLKQSTRTSQKLSVQLQQKTMELERLRISQREYITQNHQLRNEIEHLRQANDENRAKVDMLKGLTKSTNHATQEIQYLKLTISDLKAKMVDLQNDRNKILEISVLEKVELEERIQRFEAKKNSDIQYVQEMEIELSKMREKHIRLENEFKKLQIKYDQQVYNKEWAGKIFQKEHLQQQLRQAISENQQLLNKHKKEKERRNNLQKRVLQLEQTTGTWIVKAETYQAQNRALQKKCKKLERKNQQLKEQYEKKINQNLSLEQRLAKSIAISEQIIARAKRQIQGDLVTLAKSCEYKISRLKQEKDNFIKDCERNNKAADLKPRSLSKKAQKMVKNNDQNEIKTQSKPSSGFWGEKSEKSASGENMSEKLTQKKQINFGSRGSLNPLKQIDNIELRIKKQRDEMQKKLRQKMLYRKLQVANSPQKHQLREDYFRLFDH